MNMNTKITALSLIAIAGILALGTFEFNLGVISPKSTTTTTPTTTTRPSESMQMSSYGFQAGSATLYLGCPLTSEGYVSFTSCSSNIVSYSVNGNTTSVNIAGVTGGHMTILTVNGTFQVRHTYTITVTTTAGNSFDFQVTR